MRFFPSSLNRRQRAVYGAVIGFFVFAFLGTLWPIYAVFSRARPIIAGVPLSLFYLATLLVLGFFVLSALYIWEGRQVDEDS